MSNCIRLNHPDKPFAAVPFNQEIWDRCRNPQKIKFGQQDDPLFWIDWILAEAGGFAERRKNPDRIVFFISLTTNREMRSYDRHIKKYGGWVVDFLFADEYDGYRQTYYWHYDGK